MSTDNRPMAHAAMRRGGDGAHIGTAIGHCGALEIESEWIRSGFTRWALHHRARSAQCGLKVKNHSELQLSTWISCWEEASRADLRFGNRRGTLPYLRQKEGEKGNYPKSLAGQNMLGPRYRYFIDAIKRYVGASVDQKPISLSTTIFVGGGGVAMRALGMALMFAAHLAMAWFSTTTDLGNYFILIGVTNIVASAGSLGLGPAAVRFVPAFAAQQRKDLQAGYIYATLKVTVVGTLLISGAAVLVAAIFQHELTPDLHVGLFLFAILLPLTTLQFVSLDLLRACGLPLHGQTVTSFMPPVLVFGGAIIASQFGQLSFQVIGSIACISAALTVIVQLDALRRLVFRRLVGVTPQSRTVRMGAGVVANHGIEPWFTSVLCP